MTMMCELGFNHACVLQISNLLRDVSLLHLLQPQLHIHWCTEDFHYATFSLCKQMPTTGSYGCAFKLREAKMIIFVLGMTWSFRDSHLFNKDKTLFNESIAIAFSKINIGQWQHTGSVNKKESIRCIVWNNYMLSLTLMPKHCFSGNYKRYLED